VKNAYLATGLFVMCLPALAAQQDVNVPDAVEPLSTLYLVIIGLIFVGMLAGAYWYYMRWDSKDEKPGPG
jgi:hypothetical protein